MKTHGTKESVTRESVTRDEEHGGMRESVTRDATGQWDGALRRGATRWGVTGDTGGGGPESITC